LSACNSSIARHSNAKEKESKDKRDSMRGTVIQGERRWERDSRSTREQEKHGRASGGWVGVRDICACG